ncbi:MAG: response regulator [Eubacteriales bacterium]
MNILLLDDEELSLTALKRETSKVFPDAEIAAFQDVYEAIKYANRLYSAGAVIDYAFCDIELPEISGLEFARMIKSYFPQLKLFFCTAYNQYAIDAFGMRAKGYLLKPIRAKAIIDVLDEMVYDWRGEASTLQKDIRVQTFGDFEVFIDGKPVHFERAKAKELLAYLVDRKGAGVTTERIAAILFENENYDKKLKNKVTATISVLRADLRNAGIEDILIKSWNQLAVDTSKIKCDAYDYEKGDLTAVNSYRGEYMFGYEWAMFSVGDITNDLIK